MVRARNGLVWFAGALMACGSAERAAPARAPTATAAASPLGPDGIEDRAGRVRILLDSSRALVDHAMWPQAEVDLRKALELSYGFRAPWPEYRVEGLSLLARCLLMQNRAAEALVAADSALGLVPAGTLADDQRLYALHRTRAEALRAQEQPASVTSALTAAVGAAQRHPREMSAELVDASVALAAHLQAEGQALQATKTLESALVVAKAASQRSLGLRVAEPLAALYDGSGERKRAQELRSEYGLSAPPASATGTPVESVRGIAALQADFRACYQAALEQKGAVQGGVKLVIRIAADGRVAGVKADGLKLPRSTIDCLLDRASVARFEPPKGGAATITVPVTFVQQD